MSSIVYLFFFSYKLDELYDATTLRHSTRVSDGRPHQVSFSRNRGSATLTVDGTKVYGTHEGSFLVAYGDLYLGKMSPAL